MNTNKAIPTDEQAAIISTTVSFLYGQLDFGPFMVLQGYAGTGKTFCVKHALAECNARKIAISAPTNKAVRVLKESLDGQHSGPIGTIYSLLGLKLEPSGEIKKLTVPEELCDLSALHAIIIDEASMVNSALFGVIRRAQSEYGLRILFMGDPLQLPPVGESHSPVWDLPEECKFKLSKVMRHDNSILNLVTHIREQASSTIPQIKLKDYTADGEVELLRTDPFLAAIREAIHSGEFASGEAKVVAWRNATVLKYNAMIREIMFNSPSEPWVPGDRLLAMEPLKDMSNKNILLTDEEATVVEIAITSNPYYPEYNQFHLSCTRDSDGARIGLRVLHPSSKLAFENKLEELSTKAKGGQRALWKDFWLLKEAFHNVRHSYSITAHKSQGSTWNRVFVDYKDILANRDRTEALRCLYVAASRPRHQLFLA